MTCKRKQCKFDIAHLFGDLCKLKLHVLFDIFILSTQIIDKHVIYISIYHGNYDNFTLLKSETNDPVLPFIFAWH